MRWDSTSVRNGMFVMGTQGERIGKVIRCDDETFVVEKGVFFPKDYELRYDHITDISGGTIRYALTDFLRGREILQFVAEMHGMERAEAARQALRMLSEFGLDDVVDEFAVNYSMGMKKKLGLACALIHDPEVLILDEPINGLDPRAARDVQERLKLAAASGKTIFMSTHLLDMAEKVCTRVGIIHHGALVATGTLAELRQGVEQNASLEKVFLTVTEEGAAQASGP